MKVTGKLVDIKSTYEGTTITLSINERKTVLNEYETLKDSDKLNIEIKKYRKKRSVDANAYAWVLITKLAEAFGRTKEQIYEMMIKGYGSSMLVPIKSDINISGYFKYYDVQGKKNDYTYYIVYKGSSEYDSYEMSKFIDGIVNECKDVGIETDTPEEIARMKSLWTN